MHFTRNCVPYHNTFFHLSEAKCFPKETDVVEWWELENANLMFYSLLDTEGGKKKRHIFSTGSTLY